MNTTGPFFSRRSGLAAAAAALLTGAAPAAAAGRSTPHPRSDALQRDVDAIRATGASGAVALVQGPGGSTAARAGVADLATRRPVPWNPYYRIGSDTKTFTAVVALQLVGEGKVALTDTVEKWLPGAVRGHGNDGRRITLAHLLRHTSGLNDYLSASDAADLFTPEGYLKGRFRTQTPREQLKAALSKPPLWLPAPNTPIHQQRWAYSNTNYLLTGLIIERATGHPWAQEVHERIIEPLGLRHTFAAGTSAYVPQPTATAYTQFPGSPRLIDTSLATGGGADGGIISTPHDLGTFLRALMSGRLLPAAQLTAMKQTVAAADWIPAPGVRYGLGIAWRPVRGSGDGLWFHGGTHLGTVSETGVTGDGTRAVTAAVFTLRTAEAPHEAQAKAALRLVDHALRADR